VRMTSRQRLGLGYALLLSVGLTWADSAHARTAEVHVVVKADLQRLQPSGPPDEPIEPAPSAQQKARDLVASHPAFRDVTVRVVASEAPPNPRVPADFLRLIDQGVDEVVVINLGYQLRLDNFRGTGVAGVRGHVAVHSVAGRRQVVSRPFTVVARYPGDVSKESVLQAELAARGRGAPVPIEQIELGLLDQAVKQKLDRELGAALTIYHPASLPQVSRRAVQESIERMARFLARAPERHEEASRLLERYLVRYAEPSQRAEVEARLRELKRGPGRDPRREVERQQERAQNRIARSLTAAELAETFEQLVGSVVEVRDFKLDWRDDSVVMRPADRNQDFLVEQVPTQMRELPADPPAMYVRVVERRWDQRIPGLDLRIPVVHWVGCPKAVCP